MIYQHENGVTIVAKDEAKRGKVYDLNGDKYYVARGVADIKRIIDSGEYPLNRVITSKLTSLNYLFQIQGGYDQAAVPANFNDDISNWDTSNVLSMEEVFSGWPRFNQDISNWDTSRVESMYGMFKSSKYKGSYHMGPTSFNQDISNWDVSNVKNMSEMFLGATSFNQPIGNWDVSNVENMEYMFSGATSFNQDIGNWDVSNVKNMAHIFSDIDSIGILAFVGTLEYTRSSYTSFNQDISNWDVSNVNDMNGMFSGATSFNQPISNWDVSNIPGMNHMFSSATSFNQPIGNWDVSNVNGMNDMFSGATSFNQDIGNWDVSNVNGMNDMFSGATSFNQPIGNWDVSNVNGMNDMFSGAISFNQPIGNWDVSSLDGIKNMFYGATSFNAPIGKWKLKSITNMENMFREATAFNQDISSWDVSNVTQMKGLFQDAISFNQNIRNWKLNDKLPKSPTIFKDAKAFNIKEYNPFLNKKANKREVDTSTANLLPEDKKTISKIKKLLIDRDFEKIDLGLELLISLNNLELFEALLHDCKIGPNFSSLIPNKFFTGSGPAQPYLDYALINIIANAPQEARIDDSLLLKNIFSPDKGKISFNAISNSELRDFLVRSQDKFTSLTSVDISLDSSKGHNFEELFANNNITDLTVSGDLSNLKWLNNFSQLKVLIFKVYAKNLDAYETFKYLENLEELTFHSSKFEHLDFLAECKKLKKLNLSISYNSYLNDVKLENINFLNKLQQLEELDISGLSSSYVDVGLEALKNCSQIKILTLDIEERGANQLKFLNKCKSLEVLNLTSYNDFNLFGKISTIQMLSGLKSLKSISVGNLGEYATVEKLTGALPFNFFGINDSLMTDLEFKESKSPILKSDKLRVGENQISKIDGYFYHENNVNSSLEKSKLSADDKKVLSEVKKNLLSRDYNLIDDGVKKLSSLNNHLLFENLLDGCSISETRPNYFELNTNKNFTGSRPAQPYLNYALFQVLANLPEETNVVNSLLINQNTYLNTKIFNLNELYSQFISLDKFLFLESLKIDFGIFEIMNEGANPDITRENWFKNSNLKKLDISNFSGSFKFLKNLKNLESLSLEFGFYKYDFIEYFKFLENIKTLNLTNINYSYYNEALKDLDFLKNFKKIKSLNITLNGGYGLSENVESLDVIKNFNALESLVLRGIPTEINLDFLLDCKGLKFLILDFNNNNNETINLECLKNCSLLEKLILNNIGEINIEGKISDINQLNELENLRTLKIKDIIISGINDKVFIK